MKIKLVLVSCLLLANISFANEADLIQKFKLLPKNSFGVVASEPGLVELKSQVKEPELSVTGKSLKAPNKMGFDVSTNEKVKSNWFIKDVLSFSKQAHKPILEIGSGYGWLVGKMLSNNVQVVANELSVETLLYTAKRTEVQNHLSNLHLNLASFPAETNFPDNSFDAIIMERIIQFLKPVEIEIGLAKAHKWLAPGGKLFISVLAPTHKDFSKWFLPIYNQKWEAGNAWPGDGLDVEMALPEQAYNLPKYMHVMDERPLRRALEAAGFYVDKADYISMIHFENKNTRDGKETIGVIATKK